MLSEAEVKELIEMVKDEYQINQKLYQLGQDKRDALLDEDIKQLDEIVKKEEKLIDRLEKIEDKRESLAQGMSISDLIAKLDGSYAEILSELGEKFTILMGKLIDLNQLNNKLIQDSLQLNDFSLNLLTKNHKTTYGKKGDFNDENGRNSILNHKA